MLTKTISVSSETKEYDQGFHAAFLAVKQARAQHVHVRPHRAITPLKVTPYLLAQALLLPLVLCALLVLGKPLLLNFWRDCILFWSDGLGLPFSRGKLLDDSGQLLNVLSTGMISTPMPSMLMLWVTGGITLAGLALSLTMKGVSLPLKYPLRIVCVVQLIAVVYFWWVPGNFPYSIARHSEELMTIGYVIMVSTPVMLAVGYYILNQSLWIKLFHTGLILLFFTIMIPHQVLAQAFIMQHMSVLFMPVLYLCFGAVFDALVFVALYSWAASNAPANATI
jgi:hypothetical protein